MAEVLFQNMVRQEMPRPEVYVLRPDQSVEPASEMLADEVRGDLAETRERIVQTFGEQTIPTVRPETAQAIDAYFRERGWSLPQSVVIDPARDAGELENIYRRARIAHQPAHYEILCGANGKPISPACDVEHDVIIFHDHSNRYRDEVLETTRRWHAVIADDELERVIELSHADLIANVRAHLAGGLAVSAVVVARDLDSGIWRYNANRGMSGFTNGLSEHVPDPTIDDGEDYYCGPAIDASFAALNASHVVQKLQGYERDSLPLEERYDIGADITLRRSWGRRKAGFYAVAGEHSGMAGMVIEKLDELHPGIIDTMTQVADGTVKLPEALATLRETIPGDVWQLLNEPTYSAWKELGRRLGVEP